MRSTFSGALSFAVAISLAIHVGAQQPTFRSGTQVVSLFATVLDAENHLVPDLMQTDFEVLDNDKPQPLVVFHSENLPITAIVMLDTSGSMTGTIALLKSAAEQFLIRLLPQDKATVGAFNDKIELNAGFTNNRDKLVSQVKDLDYGNGTRLFDAISESLDALKGVEGRRVILVFTDGDDTSSRIGRGGMAVAWVLYLMIKGFVLAAVNDSWRSIGRCGLILAIAGILDPGVS